MAIIATRARTDAKRIAEALDAAGRRHGFVAADHELAGALYVVTQARADELDRAYPVAGIDVASAAKDYEAWRAATAPEESLDVAVCYFMDPNGRRRDLARHDGSAVLTTGQRAALNLRADDKPCPPDLPPEQVKVLDVAKQWGFV